MKKIFLVLFLICCNVFSASDKSFGYISYFTSNIGDDIQALAAKHFLPIDSVPINREFISKFNHPKLVQTIVNGWFMHTKNIGWHYFPGLTPPDKSWPPSSDIDPLMISMYLVGPFLETAFSKEGIEYFKKHAPIGTRDLHTLAEFQKRGIPAYFSGCLTLTLENTYKKRKNVIYLVDIDKKIEKFIRTKVRRCKVVSITHLVPQNIIHDNKKRLQYANKLLNLYRQAKCVVTSRLHATLPCLAFKTPVLFIKNRCDRTDGLIDLAHHCTKQELLNGEIHFDFKQPPENPNSYLSVREELIKRVSKWIEINSQ